MTPHERGMAHVKRMRGNRPEMEPTTAPGLGGVIKYRPVGPTILPTTGKPMQRATPVVNSLMAKPAAKPAIKPTTQTQKQLFGGQIKSMFPSLSPDLTRRRKARNFSVRSYSTLGV